MAKIKELSVGSTPFLKLHELFEMEQESFESKRARLFPMGKSTDENQTTSIFLASLSAVKEFREELLTKIGISKIKNRNIQLHVFTEIPNPNGEDRVDGLIVITSGKHNPVIEWASFVESKIGNNDIEEEQIDRYMKYGKSIGINSIITISNQLVTLPIDNPLEIKKRIKFDLFHWSWIYISVTAGRLLKSNCIEDEDHVYMLSELRRYFNSNKNLKSYIGMEQSWAKSTELFLDKSSKDIIEDILHSYQQEEKDMCLKLIDDTGHYVQLKTHKSKSRKEVLREMLENDKEIKSEFFIDDPKQTFCLRLNFKTRKIICSTRKIIDTGKAQAQTSKLLNIFEKDTSIEDQIHINAIYPKRVNKQEHVSLSTLLSEKMDRVQYSITNKDFGDTIKEFELIISDDLGKDLHKPQVVVNRLEALTSVFLEKVYVPML